MDNDKAIKINASSYRESYIQLAKKHNIHSKLLETWYSNYFFPLVTILSFGIELHFKWILSNRDNRLNESIDLNTHSLSKLFHYMNKTIKKQIVDAWFVFFKLRGGKLKAGQDKYRFFNTMLEEFFDVYEAMRYVHEDYSEKRESFLLIIPLFEPLLFSFDSSREDYLEFITDVNEFNPESKRKTLANAILKVIISKHIKAFDVHDINQIKENKEIWQRVNDEKRELDLDKQSIKKLCEIYTDYLDQENLWGERILKI